MGQLRSLGLAHSIFLMSESRTLRVPWWRRWATTIGQVNAVDVPSMVRAAGPAHKGHAEHAIQTVVDQFEALDDETIQIDGAVPPGFYEWRLKGMKSAWFATGVAIRTLRVFFFFLLRQPLFDVSGLA